MQIDYGALAPEIVISAAACVILVLDLGLRGRARVLGNQLALGAVALAFVFAVRHARTHRRA